jgi:hypothetical protein
VCRDLADHRCGTSLPNLMHIVMIALVMDFSSGLVLAEAVLSYVGIGCRSDDDQLRHDDQQCAHGTGPRTDGVVVAGRRLSSSCSWRWSWPRISVGRRRTRRLSIRAWCRVGAFPRQQEPAA